MLHRLRALETHQLSGAIEVDLRCTYKTNGRQKNCVLFFFHLYVESSVKYTHPLLFCLCVNICMENILKQNMYVCLSDNRIGISYSLRLASNLPPVH